MRVDLPLIRRRDRKPVGELTLIRTMHARFTDDEGKHLPSPVNEDTLIIYLRNPTGEEICCLTVPMAKLQMD
jgi:hypothetical protein